jgi:hypothetical protein
LTDADLKQFFLSKLAPAKSQVSPFVLANTDPDCDSYFLDVFQPESIVIQEDMVASLIEIWRQLKLDMLVSLEPDIRKMAMALRAPEAQSEAVSSFVYAMY